MLPSSYSQFFQFNVRCFGVKNYRIKIFYPKVLHLFLNQANEIVYSVLCVVRMKLLFCALPITFCSDYKKIQKNSKNRLWWWDCLIANKIIDKKSYKKRLCRWALLIVVEKSYTKKSKNALKKCNFVQYVLLFTTVHGMNKDVCI